MLCRSPEISPLLVLFPECTALFSAHSGAIDIPSLSRLGFFFPFPATPFAFFFGGLFGGDFDWEQCWRKWRGGDAARGEEPKRSTSSSTAGTFRFACRLANMGRTGNVDSSTRFVTLTWEGIDGGSIACFVWAGCGELKAMIASGFVHSTLSTAISELSTILTSSSWSAILRDNVCSRRIGELEISITLSFAINS